MVILAMVPDFTLHERLMSFLYKNKEMGLLFINIYNEIEITSLEWLTFYDVMKT